MRWYNIKWNAIELHHLVTYSLPAYFEMDNILLTGIDFFTVVLLLQNQ